MDLVSKSHSIHASRALLSPITSPTQAASIFRTSSLHHPNDNTSFPIIAIAIIGILATAFLLVSYYIFVIKCCLNWHRIDLLRRFSLTAGNRSHEDLLVAAAYSPAGSLQTRGLDESAIRSIPVFHFRKDGLNLGICHDKKSNVNDFVKLSECAVCLNEFEEDEKLRIIPNCAHIFHIDCIDVWLQSNANCPLCRASISTNRFQFDRVIAPSPSPIAPDEDYVVIELSNDNNNDNRTDRIDQRAAAAAASAAVAAPTPPEASPRKVENSRKKKRFPVKGTSMGDECIDTREKDDVFAVQPIRRSVSMDSSADRKMFLAIQEAVRHCQEVTDEGGGGGGEVIASFSPMDGWSTSSTSSSINNRVKRSFFSFGYGRGGSSRSAVLPVYLDP